MPSWSESSPGPCLCKTERDYVRTVFECDYHRPQILSLLGPSSYSPHDWKALAHVIIECEKGQSVIYPINEAGSGQALRECQWREVPVEHQKKDSIQKRCLVGRQRWERDDCEEVVWVWRTHLRASEAGESPE
jgi:hypothetical protein